MIAGLGERGGVGVKFEPSNHYVLNSFHLLYTYT